MPAESKLLPAAKLAPELARARSDRHFVGGALAHWAAGPRKIADLAQWLGVPPDRLPALELCLLPRPAAFARDLGKLIREHAVRNRQGFAAACHAAAVYLAAAEGPAAVADRLGVTARRVYQIRGVRRAKPRLTDADRAAIAAMLVAGHSRREIVRKTGRSRKVVDGVAALTASSRP